MLFNSDNVLLILLCEFHCIHFQHVILYISGTHYGDVIMGTMASKITSLTIVYSTIYSGADQRKHQSSAPLAFVRGIHRWPVNSPHKGSVKRKMFPFDDVILRQLHFLCKIVASQTHFNKQQPTFQAVEVKAGLIHWGRDKMDAISQTTFWSAFSWMKMFDSDWNFIEVCS